MKYLIDKSPSGMKGFTQSDLVKGQLITPLTSYANWGGMFAIDNGAFSGLNRKEFARILDREDKAKHDCLFVAVPDVVGSARRTMELWDRRSELVPNGWPLALVAQDGQEDLPVPWDDISAIFIGGMDPWKDSKGASDLVKAAKALGIHVHVGRVNSPKRFKHFHNLGADTCDGSGVCRYDHMILKIKEFMERPEEPSIFDECRS